MKSGQGGGTYRTQEQLLQLGCSHTASRSLLGKKLQGLIQFCTCIIQHFFSNVRCLLSPFWNLADSCRSWVDGVFSSIMKRNQPLQRLFIFGSSAQKKISSGIFFFFVNTVSLFSANCHLLYTGYCRVFSIFSINHRERAVYLPQDMSREPKAEEKCQKFKANNKRKSQLCTNDYVKCKIWFTVAHQFSGVNRESG